MMMQAEATPQDINAKIVQSNQHDGLDAHTCIINLMLIRLLQNTINSVNTRNKTNQQEGTEELM